MNIIWDIGTAYDFLVSFWVLTEPEKWNVRATWAAGVRSRLHLEQREFLQEIVPLMGLPIKWMNSLPAPKSAESLLNALEAHPTSDRIDLFTQYHSYSPETRTLFQEVRQTKQWQPSQLTFLQKHPQPSPLSMKSKKEWEQLLRWLVNIETFGEQLLIALKQYYEAFFAEEEGRIGPILQSSLQNSQRLAQTLPTQELISQLTGGVSFAETEESHGKAVILAPSYWATPLTFFDLLSDDTLFYLYAARPRNASLIPGEVVPDALYTSLKALADPTRLKIMRYLISQEPHTPTQLARKLRLRPPTVIHHLDILRLAHLVYLTVDPRERRYAARPLALEEVLRGLHIFLYDGGDPHP